MKDCEDEKQLSIPKRDAYENEPWLTGPEDDEVPILGRLATLTDWLNRMPEEESSGRMRRHKGI